MQEERSKCACVRVCVCINIRRAPREAFEHEVAGMNITMEKWKSSNLK